MTTFPELRRRPRRAARIAIGAAALLFVFGAGLLAPRAATAQTEAAKAEASRHYQKAIDLAHDGAYQDAVNELNRAYELSPHFAVLYNLGKAYAALGKPAEAVDAFRRYLLEGGAKVPHARRTEVEAEIRRQRARAAAQPAAKPAAAAKPAGTTATTTAQAQPAAAVTTARPSPPPAAAPAPAATTARAPAQPAPASTPAGTTSTSTSAPPPPAATAATTAPGSPTPTVTPTPTPTAATKPAGPAIATAPAPAPAPTDSVLGGVPAPPAPAPPGRMQRRVGYVLGAVGLAGGAVAVGYFLWNRDRFLTWQSTDRTLSGQKGATDYVQRQIANNQLASSIHDASVVDVAIGVSAGALLAAGIALVALAPRAEAAAPPPAATPPAPAVVHALQIAPGYIGWRADW